MLRAFAWCASTNSGTGWGLSRRQHSRRTGCASQSDHWWLQYCSWLFVAPKQHHKQFRHLRSVLERSFHTADNNTATGAAALLSNTVGQWNTANGAAALALAIPWASTTLPTVFTRSLATLPATQTRPTVPRARRQHRRLQYSQRY